MRRLRPGRWLRLRHWYCMRLLVLHGVRVRLLRILLLWGHTVQRLLWGHVLRGLLWCWLPRLLLLWLIGLRGRWYKALREWLLNWQATAGCKQRPSEEGMVCASWG